MSEHNPNEFLEKYRQQHKKNMLLVNNFLNKYENLCKAYELIVDAMFCQEPTTIWSCTEEDITKHIKNLKFSCQDGLFTTEGKLAQ